MNLKQIRDDVRSLIIEPQPGFRSNEELNRWINQAHQEMAMQYRVEDRETLQITEGISFYHSPERLLSLKGAWDSEGKSISVIPITSGADLTDDGQEEMTIFSLGDYLAIVPAPTEDSSITIFYERKPKELIADNDEPEIPEPYHKYLVSFATMRAFAKDEDFEASAIYEAEYLRGKEEISGHRVPISKDANIILELVRAEVLNAAEAAEWLNIPMKRKVWKRVELEEKGMALMQTGVIDKADLLERTEFTNKSEIVDRLKTNFSDVIELPNWGDPPYTPPVIEEDEDDVTPPIDPDPEEPDHEDDTPPYDDDEVDD